MVDIVKSARQSKTPEKFKILGWINEKKVNLGHIIFEFNMLHFVYGPAHASVLVCETTLSQIHFLNNNSFLLLTLIQKHILVL